MTEAERLEVTGTAEPVVPPRRLAAGPLSVLLDGGAVRRISFGGVEVLRGIAFLMRDGDWGTPSPVFDRFEVTEGGEAFAVRAEGRIGRLALRLAIEGAAAGRLTVAAEAVPEVETVTNRTGFVVLHPLAGVVGRPMTVEHTDGREELVVIAEAIAPDQPVFDIRALTHAPAPGLRVRVAMTGDAYEMEDQRNWTDASLKTYIRPLARPRPYLLPAGVAIRQRVEVTVAGRLPKPGARRKALGLDGPPGRMPELGVQVDAQDLAAAEAAVGALAGLGPQHLTLRVGLGEPELATAVRRAGALSERLGAALSVAVVVPGLDAAGEAARLAAAVGRPAAVIVAPERDLRTRPSGTLPEGEQSLAAIVAAVRAALPGVPVGAGSLTDFTCFNRNPPPGNADFVVHGTSAVVHAADDLSVMETLEALPRVIASVRRLAPGKAYRLGPATIGMRENPYGAAVAANPGKARIPGARTDPRHGARFAAAFGLGVLAAAAAGRVDAVTLADLAGDFGLLGADGLPTPLARLLVALQGQAGAETRGVAAPPGVVALAIGPLLVVGSLQAEAARVALPGRWAGERLAGGAVAAGASVALGAYDILLLRRE